MTVIELIEMLSVRYPTENVTIQSEAGRNIQVVGIDESLSSQYGCTVLRTVWSTKDKPVESEEDKLKRQRADINKQLTKMRDEEAKAKKKASARAKAGAKTRKKKAKKTKNATAQIASGVVPTGKRGRPRKMVEDTEFLLDFAEENNLERLAKKVTKASARSSQTSDNETDN